MPVKTKYRLPAEFKKLPSLKTKMNRLTDPNPDGVPSMMNPEVALHASHDSSFETARSNENDDIPLWVWKVALYEEIKPQAEKLAATAKNRRKDGESDYLNRAHGPI